jgi:lysophospholipase L1-like esterase
MAADVLKVVCFGDSITGFRPREQYLHSFIKYSDVLQAMLEAKLGLGRALVLNRGWAGDKTYPDAAAPSPGALARLKSDVLDERPHLATVLIGGNDQKDTPAQREVTRGNLQKLFAGLAAAGIRTLALQYHVLPNPQSPETAWGGLDDNNDLIEAAARAQKMPVLNMATAMQAALGTYRLAELVSLTDGVHLAPAGEIIYARAIFAELERLGWLSPQAAVDDRLV